MLIKYFLFLSLFFVIPSTLLSQNITGKDSLCLYECAEYTIENASGGLFVWNIDGGKLDINTGANVKICWREEGVHTIRVLNLANNATNPILTYDVYVIEQLNPQVFFPEFPICSVDSLETSPNGEFETLECKTACANTTATYSATGSEGSSFEWIVEGNQDSTISGSNIDVNWGEAGFGYILLNEISAAGCNYLIEQCFEILPLPTATIINNTNAVNPCVGQNIYLTADSPEAISFVWTVNNTIVSDEQTLQYQVQNSNDINISLITISECLCRDTTSYVITPKSNPGPEISCVGTTCAGAEETYYASDICGEYIWTITNNGVITEGGTTTDNYITVIWNNGPLGEVSLSTQNCQTPLCDVTTTMQVPIIDPTVTIQGPAVTCKKGRTIFTAPKLEGTRYNWSISGNGFISSGNFTNQITVTWDEVEWADNSSTITLNYENCLLECSGSATKTIDLKPEFFISSFLPEACVGQPVTVEAFSGYNYASGDWQAFDQQGLIIASESNSNFITFNMPNSPGLIEVTMTNNSGNYCNNTSSGFVTANALPSPPTAFIGPQVICLNELYSYEADISLSNNLDLVWTFRDGNNETTIAKNSVQYEWMSNGPYFIDLVVNDIVTNCESEPLTTEIKTADVTTIEGPTDACIKSINTYNLTGVDSDNINWSIVPESAGHFRNTDTNETDVTFYEVGKHQLIAEYCGTSISIEVDIHALPSFSINAPIGLCINETGPVDIITDASNTVEVTDEQNNIISTSARFDTGPGIYTVKTISPFGCEETEVFSIDTYILPDIRISTPDKTAFCNEPIDIALVGLNTLDGYTYQWYKDNVPVAETGASIQINAYGEYHLEAVNINGCISKSNTIKVHENCACKGYGDDRCEGLIPCESADSINFEFTSLGFCNAYSFTNASTANVNPNNLYYDFQDLESGVNNLLAAPNGEHTFSQAGYFHVMLLGKVPSLNNPNDFCDDYEAKLIEVPVAARFETQEGCSNTQYLFLDKSTFLASNTITDWEWNFGDPSSGALNFSTDRNPSHTYSDEGIYTVTLTITAGTGCRSRYIQNIRVLQSPEFELNLPFEQCIAEAIKFEAVDTGNLIKFIWEFDDPTGGNTNYIESPSTLHKFETPGIYNVSLTCQNNLGCETTVVKAFEVGVNSLTGDITTTASLPVCEGDSVTLTAPNGGAGYIWSNGDVGQSIKVADPKDYSVTVINSAACDYVPDDFTLTVIPIIPVEIIGYKYYDNSFNSTTHFGSVEICEGQSVSLRTQFINGASYTWSSGSTFYFDAQADIQNLSPGSYNFTVDITLNTGCSYTSEPFTVKINPLPAAINISSSTTPMCTGEPYVLSVDSPDSELTYHWNTGQTGTTITAQMAGTYFVTAINKFGCEQKSNALTIHEKPNVSYFQTGCFETCFPDEICFPQSNNAATISWLLDGIVIPSVSGNSIIVDQAGEYQVVVESFAGCIDTSDILTLEAMASDQSVSGIVYVDDNSNGSYDIGEELLENININLMQGLNVLATSTTNNQGEYNIDPVNAINTYVLLDTIGTGLNLTDAQLRYDLIYDYCVEDKIQDFPVDKSCVPVNNIVELFTCENQSVTYNGQQYFAGDTDSYVTTSINGCDTTHQITVNNFLPPALSITTIESCFGENNGSAEIVTQNTDLSFSIDGINFSTDLLYQNLVPGTYMLNVLDLNGCQYDFPFSINEKSALNITFNVVPSCENNSNGSIEMVTTETNLMYSLDGITFNPIETLNNLTPNTYSIIISNDLGCEGSFNVNVDEVEAPVVTYDVIPSCPNTTNGSINITSADPGTTFSVNGIDFDSNLNINNLATGPISLYAANTQGCTVEYNLSIPENTPPAVTFISTNTCINENNGSIQVQSPQPGLMYSIDGTNFNSQNTFNNLNAGSYILYFQDSNGCVYEETHDVETFASPDLSLNTTLSCNSDGSIEVIALDGNNYMYSLTNNNFDNNNTFINMDAGVYSLFIMTNDNCVYEQSFTIQESVEPLLQFDITSSCASDATGSIEITSSNLLVEYALDGGIFSDNNQFTNLSANNYVLSVQDENGCIFTHDLSIEEEPSLEVQFDNPTVDCSMLSTTLSPIVQSGNDLSYSWSNGATSHSIEVATSGNYEVQITNGCETETYQYSVAFDNINEKEFYEPNVFTPNQDGDNDEFKIFKSVDLDIIDYQLLIFDRWGNKVHENNEFDKAWDGRFNSEFVKSGVYVWTYKIKAQYCNQEISLEKAGNVTVLN